MVLVVIRLVEAGLLVFWEMTLFVHSCHMCQHIHGQILSFLASNNFLLGVPVFPIVRGVLLLVYHGVFLLILVLCRCLVVHKSFLNTGVVRLLRSNLQMHFEGMVVLVFVVLLTLV